MPRIRELGIYDSALPPGPRNAISDVAGVTVGHFTLIAGPSDTGPAWRPGSGPFRTGVTLVLPHGGNLYEDKVVAAVHTINGFGKPHGFEQVRELGLLETPIALTGTLNVPRVADALISLAIEQNPHIGVGFAASGWRGHVSVNPLVGETSDGYLSDLQGRPIGLSEVRAALAAAAADVAEGAVGAGTGTSCYGWKGGIGTASRVLVSEEELTQRRKESQGAKEEREAESSLRLRPFAPLRELAAPGSYTVGALVQTNMGRAEELTIGGVPVGRYLRPPEEGSRGQVPGAREEPSSPGTWPLEPDPSPQGSSIMIVLATDAPLDSRGLGRLAKRAVFGLARTGTPGHGGSGDFVIAFSVPRPLRSAADLRGLHEQPLMDLFALAVVECVEEAIYNSLLMAQTVVGRHGHIRHALPTDEVKRLVHRTF
jgi:D-aminopeptidase